MALHDYTHVLLFGGSFDPPHVAHTTLPPVVRDRIGAQVVAYLPAARTPGKTDRFQTPAEHRLAMLRLALRGVPGTVVRADEIDRAADGRPSYTVDTLRALRDELGPGVRLRLLIGSDQMLSFDRWREPEAIERLAEPAVMVRPPETISSLLERLGDGDARRRWAGRLIETPRLDVSSTELRRALASGGATDRWMDPAVRAYIDAHGLYRGSG